MISTLPRSSRQFSRQGFSLIEVAIALVIFVIGALAIIRIFPGALNVINNNGDQQVATNLNRDLTTTLKSRQIVAATDTTPKIDFNALPDAIFNNSNADGSLRYSTWDPSIILGPKANHSADWVDEVTSVIGVPRFNGTLPTTDELETMAGRSALSRYRTVVGERARLEIFNEGANQVYYATTQFPVSVQPQGNPSVTRPIRPTISQDYTLENVRIQPNGVLDFSQTTVDTGTTSLANITVNAGSVLYVTYRYISVGSPDKYWGVSEEAVPVGAQVNLKTPGIQIRVQPPLSGRESVRFVPVTLIPTSVVPEIVKVRLRQYVGLGEFGKDATATAIEQVADARRGLVRVPDALALYPPAANPRVVNAGTLYNLLIETKPLVVDYMADWSFLLQEGAPLVSSSADLDPALLTGTQSFRQIALGAPYVEDQAPVGVYSLLIDGVTPTPYRSGYGTISPNPNVNFADRLVLPDDPQDREEELRSGRATFIVENSNARARVAYKTRDQWVQQLAVAARSYKPFVPITTVSGINLRVEPWRDYVLGNDNYLYFHAGEAGKTISLSYTILVTNNNNVVESRTVVDKPFVIETRLINRPNTVPALFSNTQAPQVTQVARVQLTNFAGGDLAFADLVSIQAVRGTSVTSRTAYINGNKYAQTLLTSNRGSK